MTRLLVIAAAVLFLVVIPVEIAKADPTPAACPDPAGLTGDALATAQSCQALSDRLDAANGYLSTISAGSGSATVSGTVALAPDDAHRLDLAWWGMWALVGLVLVLIVAPRWYAAFNLESGKGV